MNNHCKNRVLPRRGLLPICLAVLSVGIVWNVNAQKTIKPTKSASTNAFEHYREWTCANPKPFWVPGRIAVMCARAAPKPNPHEAKYIRVYLNDIAEEPFLTQKTPRFAVGSIIIKEKLPQEDSTKPELLTVMRKREAGFDAENGDWEYFVLSGNARKIVARGKLENCQGCHVPLKEQGYVFRNYLPAETQEKLQ